jgi:hypothetical protein
MDKFIGNDGINLKYRTMVTSYPLEMAFLMVTEVFRFGGNSGEREAHG